MGIEDSVTSIKGVGEQRALALSRLGIHTIKDLADYFPRDYQDRSLMSKISDFQLDEINTSKLKMCAEPEISKARNLIITKIKFCDDTGIAEAVWYNQPYLKNYFKRDKEYVLTGKVADRFNKIILESPEYEVFDEKAMLSSARIVPVYSLRDKLSQKMFRGLVYTALIENKLEIHENLPLPLLQKYDLLLRADAVRNIHFPESDELFYRARTRLVFEEIFILQLMLFRLKGISKQISPCRIKNYDIGGILKALSFKLTDAQARVLNDIMNDLRSGLAMNRLLQGDVGSGKTAVAAIAAYIVISNGYQAALMAPTEVLAAQHYESIKKLFDGLGIGTGLLTGSLKKKEKEKLYLDIKTGEIKMIIGTHAVIQKGVEFKNLGLSITDEQHRFGVRQRGSLANKGDNPHVLVMSATPIPRTLALVLYGDLDISIIDQLPPGRQPIKTFAVNSTYRSRYHNFLREQLKEGRQAYIICPAIGIDENETETDEKADLDLNFKNVELESVLKYVETLREALPEFRIGILHGKLKTEEKTEIMNSFSKGDIDIIIATTVIEVGINVPNSTVIVIENADRFGLAQLHQLRGRVGRGVHKSFCILVTDSKSQLCKKRMNVMTKTNDGFVISETDLKLRGQGDFFGTRQHGLPEMKIANLFTDMDILPKVEEAVEKIKQNDPKLELPQHSKILEEVEKKMNFGGQSLNL